MALVTAMGVDPGFASLGVGVLRFDTDQPNVAPEVLDAYVVKTKKSKGPVLADDLQRMHQLWMNVEQSVQEFKPDVMGVEAYTVHKPGQGGHAGKGVGWKAIYMYSMTCGIAFAHGIPIRNYMPADLHRRIGVSQRASKASVEAGVRRITANIDALLEGIPGGSHEHACDACGHGLMALTDYVNEMVSKS